MEGEEVRFTTFDNPWNPFTQWREWYFWDEFIGKYHTCGELARTKDRIRDSDRRDYEEDTSDDDIAADIFRREHFFTHKTVKRSDYETKSATESEQKADE